MALTIQDQERIAAWRELTLDEETTCQTLADALNEALDLIEELAAEQDD